MPKTKINWSTLKQEYFKSELIEIKEFFQTGFNKGSIRVVSSSTIELNTRGWRTEKENYLKTAAEQAKEKILEENKQQIEEFVQDYLKESRYGLELMMKQVREGIPTLVKVSEVVDGKTVIVSKVIKRPYNHQELRSYVELMEQLSGAREKTNSSLTTIYLDNYPPEAF